MSRRFTLTCSANKHVENRGLMDHAEYRIFVYPTGANINSPIQEHRSSATGEPETCGEGLPSGSLRQDRM
jgi:hypothetical protein